MKSVIRIVYSLLFVSLITLGTTTQTLADTNGSTQQTQVQTQSTQKQTQQNQQDSAMPFQNQVPDTIQQAVSNGKLPSISMDQFASWAEKNEWRAVGLLLKVVTPPELIMFIISAFMFAFPRVKKWAVLSITSVVISYLVILFSPFIMGMLARGIHIS